MPWRRNPHRWRRSYEYLRELRPGAVDEEALSVLVARVRNGAGDRLRERVVRRLRRCTAQCDIDTVCREAAALGHGRGWLVALVVERGWEPSEDVAPEHRVELALRAGRMPGLRDASPAAVESMLAKARQAERREPLLEPLAALRRPDARATLVERALRHGDAVAVEALERAVSTGTAPGPQEPADQAAATLLFGTEAAYDALDATASLTASLPERLHPSLRLRMAARIRASGRADWQLAWTHAHHRRPDERSDDEWDTAVRLLVAEGEWAELRRLAAVAAPRRAAAVLRTLGDHHAAGGLEDLVTVARRCGPEPPLGLAVTPTVLLDSSTSLPWTVAFAPDVGLLAVGSARRDGEVAVYALPAGDKTCVLLPGSRTPHRYAGPSVRALAVSRLGIVLVARSRRLSAYRLPQGDLLWSDDPSRSEFPWMRDGLPLSADGTLVAHPRPGTGSVVVRTVAVGDVVAEIATGWAAVTAVALSADGTRLVAGGDGGQARIWRIPEARPVHRSTAHHTAVAQVLVDRDRVITSDGLDEIRVWDLDSGEPVTHRIPVPRLSPLPGLARFTVAAHGGLVHVAVGLAPARWWSQATGAPVPAPDQPDDHAGAVRTVGPGGYLLYGPSGQQLGRQAYAMWLGRSALATVADTPSERIRPADLAALRRRPGPLPGEESPWVDLCELLTVPHRRYAIELADDPGVAPGPTDIALEDP